MLLYAVMRYAITDLNRDFPADDACLEWLVNYLYPDGIKCIKCQEITKHYKIKSRKAYACSRCGHHVYPTAGTIWHKSSTPLKLWFYAMFIMANTKSGISAKQLEREIGVTYKTAWRMFHHIRILMSRDIGMLSGEVEADETFIHPNPFKRSSAQRRYGRDARRKGEVVFGIVQRGGPVKVWHVKSAGARVLQPLIQDNVKRGSTIHTDGYGAYRILSRMGYTHRWTDHGRGQYYTPDSYTQNIENVWSHFKRGIKGVYRHIGDKYIQSYANEYAWRYNHRNAISIFWSLMGEFSPLS